MLESRNSTLSARLYTRWWSLFPSIWHVPIRTGRLQKPCAPLTTYPAVALPDASPPENVRRPFPHPWI